MRSKKGFTLIELLAVVIILGILLALAIPSIHQYLIRGTDEYYSSLENTVMLSGRDYLNDYRALLPKEINNVTVIELKELVDNSYIEDVVDSNNKACDAKVTAKKIGKNEYEYYSCLICEGYQTKGEACLFDENNNITEETKNYSVIAEPTEYIIEQGEEFELPYGKAYYKGQLVSDKVVGSPKTIDTNKLGTTKVAYVYQGAKAEIIVKVVDRVAPSIPQVVLRKENARGNIYQGGWYSGNIYEEYESTDYSKVGVLGSGIERYEISSDGITFSALSSNYHIDLENGEYSYYVRSVDKSGNVSDANTYSLKIDKEIPRCELKSSGTLGNNEWYISDAKIEFDTITEEVSGIKSQSIDSPSITSDVKNKMITGTVEDNAGNVGKCNTLVSVDKTNPTVSYSVLGGIYNSNKTVTVSASDTYYSYMNIHVYKNGSITNEDNSITANSKSYTLTHGSYTVYTQAYDESGRSQSQSPDNGSGWYYQNYVIDTVAPTCTLEVKSGTPGKNNWYTSDVTIGFKTTDGTGSSIVTSSVSQSRVTNEGKTIVTGTVTDQAGNVGSCSIEVMVEKIVPIPSITYNGGSNTCSWKNNYNLTLASNPISGVSTYEVDWDNNGTVDTTTGGNFIPWNGFNSHTTRFRAVSNAGNRSEWTGGQHIHMDTEKPVHTNWSWGEVTKDVARLYIQGSDNVGINKVQCQVSTASGSYNNWKAFDAVWDSSTNSYRCDITPSTFNHYGQTYKVNLYIYDYAGNGGYYNQTSVNIPAAEVDLLSGFCRNNMVEFSEEYDWDEDEDQSYYVQYKSCGSTTNLIPTNGANTLSLEILQRMTGGHGYHGNYPGDSYIAVYDQNNNEIFKTFGGENNCPYKATRYSSYTDTDDGYEEGSIDYLWGPRWGYGLEYEEPLYHYTADLDDTNDRWWFSSNLNPDSDLLYDGSGPSNISDVARFLGGSMYFSNGNQNYWDFGTYYITDVTLPHGTTGIYIKSAMYANDPRDHIYYKAVLSSK